MPVVQVGTDDGFLPEPTELRGSVVIGPGERLDLVVDFAPYAGETLTVVNDAPTPFPDGDPVAPPADRVMQFRVTRALDLGVPDASLAGPLRKEPFRISGVPVTTRSLVLWEGADEQGRLQPLLGPTSRGGLLWDDSITEHPGLDDVEIWELYNTTPDAHPIHLHLVAFEVLDRAPFHAAQDRHTGALKHIRIGEASAARPAERGPKDTVQTFPGEVTRVKAHFDKPGRYVWHCHILSHEDHEMMRPYVVGVP